MCSVVPRHNISHLQDSAQHPCAPYLYSILHTHDPLAIHIYTDPQRQPTRMLRFSCHCQRKGVVCPTCQPFVRTSLCLSPLISTLSFSSFLTVRPFLALPLGRDSSCTSRLSCRLTCRLAFSAAGASIFHCFSSPLRPVSFKQQKTEDSPAPQQNTSFVRDCLCGHLNSAQPVFYS